MTRGGKREGSGRKTIGEAPGILKTYRLPPEVAQAIKDKAAAAGISQPRLITLAVEAFTPAQPSEAPEQLPSD